MMRTASRQQKLFALCCIALVLQQRRSHAFSGSNNVRTCSPIVDHEPCAHHNTQQRSNIVGGDRRRLAPKRLRKCGHRDSRRWNTEFNFEEEIGDIFSTTKIANDFSGKISTMISYEVSKNGDVAIVGPPGSSLVDTDEITTTTSAVARDIVRLSTNAIKDNLRFSTDVVRERILTDVIKEKILPVVSSSLLITASTIGASCLVLPELAAGPGIAATSAIFLGAYAVCLISGLLIAEVAIKQYEYSGTEPPRSFKQLAEANLGFGGPAAAGFIAAASIFKNACILTFDFSKAGTIGSTLLGGTGTGLEALATSTGVAALLAMLLATQTASSLSAVASLIATGLVVAFAGLLLPGLSNVDDVFAVFATPGTASNTLESMGLATPVILTTLVYMKIIPSVAQILEYDRFKTVTSIIIGSFVPLWMYFAWITVVLGGGVDIAVGLGGPLVTAFTIAAVAGSTVGTGLSIVQEIDTIVDIEPSTHVFSSSALPGASDVNNSNNNKKNESFSLKSAVITVSIPLLVIVAGLTEGENLTLSLKLAGGIGSPLLYGVIPAWMAINQRRELGEENNIVPGGVLSISILGIGASVLVGNELARQISAAVASLA